MPRKQPRVGFDARWIQDLGSGVAVYARELLRSLLQTQARVHYLLLFSSESTRDAVLGPLGEVPDGCLDTIVVRDSPTGIRSQLALPRLLRTLELDIFHSPEFVVPFALLAGPRRRVPAVVVTIHDVIPLSLDKACPKSLKSRVRPLYRFALGVVARRADAVLTVSDASRRELTRLLRVPGDRVHVVHNGVSPVYRPGETSGRGSRLSILYVGRQDPYKGLRTLVAALAELRSRYGVGARLLVAGSPDPRYPEAMESARSLGVSDSVEWLGYLSDGGLVSAYQRASVLALPSHFEGFGLPVLEAMACGTPVVCTRAGGLPEVAGDAAELVEPGDAHQLCLALHRVLTDAQHASRLARLGVARAALFSWKRAAEQTLNVYREVLARRR